MKSEDQKGGIILLYSLTRLKATLWKDFFCKTANIPKYLPVCLLFRIYS
jgi:hypothetical protein